jgi:hypothetical protein
MVPPPMTITSWCAEAGNVLPNHVSIPTRR